MDRCTPIPMVFVVVDEFDREMGGIGQQGWIMAGRGYGQGVAVARDLSQEACARASTVGFQTSEKLIGCGGY